ncbi:MAG: exo-alpha-sialidase [Bryobacterales bacterium]
MRKRDGTIVAYMRDNGLAPKRIPRAESHDDGETWSAVVDTDFLNPGASVEPITLDNGDWLLVYNDLEEDRYSLAVSISTDEGKTWSPPRHLDRDEAGKGRALLPVGDPGKGRLHPRDVQLFRRRRQIDQACALSSGVGSVR